jgi:transposase
MGHSESDGRGASRTPPPSWWVSEGGEIPLESLANGDAVLPVQIDESHQAIRVLARVCLGLKERLEQELNHRYGSRSEKRHRRKKGGGGDRGNSTPGSSGSSASPGDSTGPSSTAAGEPGTSPDPDTKKAGHGRRPVPEGLPREEILIDEEGVCCKRCGGPMHRLERVESYRYDYVPGYIRVRVIVRWRHVCKDPTCDAPFWIAKLPPEPIKKSRVTAGFLAHLLVTKFADHCPLYRFRKILLRQKVDLPLSTLVDYCKKATALLKRLWELLRQHVLFSAIIKTDDTHVRVRLPRKKGVLKGHLWAYKGDEDHPYVVFEFTPDWSGKHSQEFLKNYKGYIQADAYKGYDALFKADSGKIEVGCWAHARRRWIKAEKSSPRVAGEALDMIGELYAVEEAIEELTPDERRRVRQERSAPVLERLRIWMEDQEGRVLPKSSVGEAIEYAQNQWGALVRFPEDGRLEIDNTAIERELRRVALGRKNWMAAGSEVGGETAAIGYTMIASATACGVDPVEWLTDVLERIVICPDDELVDLLPDRWKAARKTQSPDSTDTKVDQSPDVLSAPMNASAASPAAILPVPPLPPVVAYQAAPAAIPSRPPDALAACPTLQRPFRAPRPEPRQRQGDRHFAAGVNAADRPPPVPP